jgi:hypothetical protein
MKFFILTSLILLLQTADVMAAQAVVCPVTSINPSDTLVESATLKINSLPARILDPVANVVLEERLTNGKISSQILFQLGGSSIIVDGLPLPSDIKRTQYDNSFDTDKNSFSLWADYFSASKYIGYYLNASFSENPNHTRPNFISYTTDSFDGQGEKVILSVALDTCSAQ